MAFPKFKIADDDGNVADVQSNRLDVNSNHPAGNATLASYSRFDAATTATAISDGTNGIAESVTDCKEIIIQPDDGNAGYIRVGGLVGAVAGLPVSTINGIRLNAGDTLILAVSSTANVYIDASGASQLVNVSIVT